MMEERVPTPDESALLALGAERDALRARCERVRLALATIQRSLTWSDAHEDRDMREGLVVLAIVVERARSAIDALEPGDLDPPADGSQ